MNPIDNFLNRFTMYRVVEYGLLTLTCYSFILSLLSSISFNPLELFTTLASLTFACYFSNLLFGKLFKVPINAESSIITALILFFLLWPSSQIESVLLFLAAGLIAMASKYIIAFRGKHIFNPAAVAVFLLMFLNNGAIWWIATPFMLPAVLVVGLLIVRKIRRFTMFFTFLTVSLLTFLGFVALNGKDPIDELKIFYFSFPVVFLGTVMLTEPLTTPPTKKLQIIYAAIVGVIFSLQTPLGHFYPTPEVAILVGNLFSFAASPKYKLKLKLLNKVEVAKKTLEFSFEKPANFSFSPGQYLEWTLPILRTDGRGNRRYFTIASSPTEDKLRLAVKLNTPSSTFKKFLSNLKDSQFITAGSLAGDFTLKHSKKNNLVFIAGGIGITPFRSIIKELVDNKDTRRVVLFYSNKTSEEIAYQEFLGDASQRINLEVVYVLTETENIPSNFRGEKGRITSQMLSKYIKNTADCDYFLSGPISMVNGYKSLLKSMNANGKNIFTDYFPGF